MFNTVYNNKRISIVIALIWFSINAFIVYKKLPEYRKYVKIDEDIKII